MADYRAWQGVGEALSGGVDAYTKAKQAKAATMKAEQDRERQSRLDQDAESQRINKDYQFEREMKLKEAELAQKRGLPGGVGGMTPGRKAADVAFGKDYADYQQTGAPTMERGLNTLEGAKAELKGSKDISGPVRGAFPDWIRAVTNPEAVAVKERIRGAVQNTLKQTLGAQFTEKEGERIFNQAYNDRLPPEESIKRLDSIIGELRGQKENKENMGQYFEKQGTLTGYKAPTAQHTALAQQILNDPEAEPDDIAWAKQQMGQ